MEYSKTQDNVRVTLSDDTFEGYNGDYDPNDPDDQLLMRFDVYHLVNGDWEAVDNASYCTNLPNTIKPEDAERVMGYILSEVADAVRQDISIKKRCERLSWIEV